jgi:pyruvate dehydrogenase E2 component (dihydrolipoamide acetyltransferase)
MAKIYEMPELAESVIEGEVVRWIKKAGEHVTMDEPFVEVMTEKVTVEIPAPYTGTLLRTMAGEGHVLPVGAPLAVFGDPGENVDALLASHVPSQGHGHAHAAPAAPPPQPEATASAPPGAGPYSPPREIVYTNGHGASHENVATPGRALAAPAVRRLARERGIDLARVAGSGPNGRIRREDLDGPPAQPAHAGIAAAIAREGGGVPATGAALTRERRAPLSGLRRVIAQRMTKAKHTAAHTLNVDEAEMTAIADLRKRLAPIAAEQGAKLTYLPFIVKAVAAVLQKHPMLNASLDEAAGQIVYHDTVNVGIAVDTEAGLTVPVIHHVESRSLVEIAKEIARLAEAARAGKLGTAEVTGGTFTVTNQGSVGGLFTMPVINVPEAAILGVHQIKERAVVRDGAVVPRLMTYFSLSFDHRLIDGAEAARFTNDLIALIENPERLLLAL